MTNSKNSKEMYEIAEKIAIDDFDRLEEKHEFSDTYNQKKKIFMQEIKRKGKQSQGKRKRNRLIIATACLLIGIPTTSFGAVKVYDMLVHKNNYEVNVSVTKMDAKKSNNWYKLKVDHLPENMEAIDHTGGLKYSFKDNFAKGGFSFFLWNLGKNSDFQTLYSNSYEEKEINGKKAIIIKKGAGNDRLMFDRQVYLLFEKEGIMLESYIGADVSNKMMMDVLENISLEPTSKEKATYIADYDEYQTQFSNEDKPTEFSVIPLKKDSKQLFHVGEVFPVTIEQLVKGANGTISRQDNLEFSVENVEIFNSIKEFSQENFNNLGLDVLSENKAIDQTKKLIPYKRDVYKEGNGKDSVDELIKSENVSLKFVYLTTKVKNIGKQPTEEIYMSPSLQVLNSENNAWNYAKKEGISEKSIMTGEVDYLEPHGNGKSFYNIGNIQPGQTMKIHLGYFVDEDKLDSMFLDTFHYSGVVDETEDMNASDRWWIDLRQ